MMASTESAARRPSICEASFCLTAASISALGAAGRGHARLDVLVGDEGRARRELRARLRLRLLRHARVVLDAGQERGREDGDEDRAGERGAERGAELGGGVLQAADLGALLGRDGGDGDGAELRCQGADAEADDEQRDDDDRGIGARSRLAISTTMPPMSASRPMRTTRRGLACGRSRGMPTAASEQRERKRQQAHPGRDRREAETTERNSGTMKNTPDWIRNMNRKLMSPPVDWWLRSKDGAMSGS